MATQNVSGTVLVNTSFLEVMTSGLLANVNISVPLNIQLSYTNATNGALTVDQVHGQVYALAASTPQTIDLTSLTDPGGNAINFARVRDIIFYNADTVTSHVVNISAGASNGWSYLPPDTNPLILVAKGGMIWLHDPNNAGGTNGMVTGGSSKTILMDPGSNTVSISVLIVGGTVS